MLQVRRAGKAGQEPRFGRQDEVICGSSRHRTILAAGARVAGRCFASDMEGALAVCEPSTT